MTDTQAQAIQQDAERAASEGKTPNEACPHPFSSKEGRQWVAYYWAMWDELETEKGRQA